MALLRDRLIPTLGHLGDAAIAGDATRYAETAFKTDSQVTGSIREAALNIWAYQADAARWDMLHERARTETGPVARQQFYNLLGSARDPGLAQKALTLALTDEAPVPMRAFRLTWPLVTQRRLLMPLVQPRGIYCFYSLELVKALVALLDGRPALEIAAGDGTLSRFLAARGARVKATDDQSWGHAVTYPAEVEKLDAAQALARHRPRAVLCSFPPPGNAFERRVFTTPGVELYVVVTTRHQFAAGDWNAYREQTAFEWSVDEPLSRLVLPPELDPAVLLFRRRA